MAADHVKGLADGFMAQLVPFALLGVLGWSVWASNEAIHSTQELGRGMERVEKTLSSLDDVARKSAGLTDRVTIVEGRLDRMGDSIIIIRKDVQDVRDRAAIKPGAPSGR